MKLDEFEQSISEPKLEVYIIHTPWSDVKKCRLEGKELEVDVQGAKSTKKELDSVRASLVGPSRKDGTP